jgi:2-polyprenyl-6-hydroxyphenyl methylase/3-demethylubiquinone-9 3-methyltransferase
MGVSKYHRLWDQPAEDWDRDYASGELDFYGSFREQGRYSVLVGFVQAFPRKPRVLDLGSGVGVLRARIPDAAIAGYVGLDPSAVAVDLGNKQKFPMSAFQIGDRPMPGMGLFDIIILNEMIYYVEDVEGLLDHLEGYMAEDGWIVSSMFQHPGDVALRRTLAVRLTEFESLTIRRESPRKAWRLACYAKKPAAIPSAVVEDHPLEPSLGVATH